MLVEKKKTVNGRPFPRRIQGFTPGDAGFLTIPQQDAPGNPPKPLRPDPQPLIFIQDWACWNMLSAELTRRKLNYSAARKTESGINYCLLFSEYCSVR